MYKALKVFFSSKSRREKILKNVEIIKKMWESEKILHRAYNNINLNKQ
jgi:hypothetical protein